MYPVLGILLEQYKMNEEIHIEKEKVNGSFEKPTIKIHADLKFIISSLLTTADLLL